MPCEIPVYGIDELRFLRYTPFLGGAMTRLNVVTPKSPIEK
jgi:hypothetical protein